MIAVHEEKNTGQGTGKISSTNIPPLAKKKMYTVGETTETRVKKVLIM